jgi:hypothetical protein
MSGEGEADSFLARAQEGMGTRFQSQASIEKQNEQRDKDWQAAYARCVFRLQVICKYMEDRSLLAEVASVY